jgi:hypothetical protein
MNRVERIQLLTAVALPIYRGKKIERKNCEDTWHFDEKVKDATKEAIREARVFLSGVVSIIDKDYSRNRIYQAQADAISTEADIAHEALITKERAQWRAWEAEWAAEDAAEDAARAGAEVMAAT